MPLDYDLRTTRRPVPRQLDLNGDWSLSSSRSKGADASISTSIASMQSPEMPSAVPPSSLQRPLPMSQTNLYDSSRTLGSLKSMSVHSGLYSSTSMRSVEAERASSWRPRSSVSTTSSNQDDNDDSQPSRFSRGYDPRELVTSPTRRRATEFASHRSIRTDLNTTLAKLDSPPASHRQQSTRETKPADSDPFLTPQRKQRTEKELPDRKISPYRPLPRSTATDLNPHLECATTEASNSDRDHAPSESSDSNRVEDFLSRADNYSWSRSSSSFVSTAPPSSVREQAQYHQSLSSEGAGSPRRAWSDASSIAPTSPASSSVKSPVSHASSPFVPTHLSPRLACTSKQSLQSMADRREALYEFRKRMRKAFDRVENMVDAHRDLFAKRDSTANEPIYDDVMAQQAESLAGEVFADLKSLRDQFQGLISSQSPAVSTSIEQQAEASTCEPKAAGFLATTNAPSSSHSSCCSQDDDDDDDTSTRDQTHEDRDESAYSIASPPASPSSSISTSMSFGRAANISFSSDDVSSIDNPSFSSSQHAHGSTATDRESVFRGTQVSSIHVELLN